MSVYDSEDAKDEDVDISDEARDSSLWVSKSTSDTVAMRLMMMMMMKFKIFALLFKSETRLLTT